MTAKNENRARFVKWFQTVLKDEASVLKIFDKKSFYTVYGEHSLYIADNIFKTRKRLSSFGGSAVDEDSAKEKEYVIDCIHFKENMLPNLIREYIFRCKKSIQFYIRNPENHHRNEWIWLKTATPTNLTAIDSLISNSSIESSFNMACVVLDLRHHKISLGIGVCNNSSYEFELREYEDNEQYTTLQSIVVSKGIKECIYKCTKNNAKQFPTQFKNFTTALQKCNVKSEDISGNKLLKSISEHDTHLQQMLTNKESKKLLTFNNHALAKTALNLIIAKDLFADSNNHKKFSIAEISVKKFMKLDSAAMSALNLFPTVESSFQKNDSSSLYGVLCKCRSSMGDRLLSKWLRQPLIEAEQIYRRQKLIKLFVENDECRDILFFEQMIALLDLEKVRNKLTRKTANLKDLVDLYYFIDRIPFVANSLKTIENCEYSFDRNLHDDDDHDDGADIRMDSNVDVDVNIDADADADADVALAADANEDDDILLPSATTTNSKSEACADSDDSKRAPPETPETPETPLALLQREFIAVLDEVSRNFRGFSGLVEHAIDLQRVRDSKEYWVKYTWDEHLSKYTAEKQRLMKDMENELANARQNIKIKKSKKSAESVKMIKHSKHGYVFKVTKGQKKHLSKSGLNYYVVQTLKSGVLFSNSLLNSKSKEYVQYENKYKQRQKSIVDGVVDVTLTYLSVINNCIRIFSELDVLLSLAHVSANSPTKYCLPRVLAPSETGENSIRISGARHPCLELQDMMSLNSEISGNRSNNTEVVANDVVLVKGESGFQIVTGPNMGGKSTYIRMIGVIVLMAQIGMYVPCDSAKITIVDSILARVGAGDNLLKGVSTFMAEMLEASTILSGASEHSLIIIDELGRGTSTYDGFGIAYAISEHIVKQINCFCLFATHFHELTSLSVTANGVINKHVSAQCDENEKLLTMLYKIKDGPCPQSFGIQVAELAKFPKEIIADAKQKANELESFMQHDNQHNSNSNNNHSNSDGNGNENENENGSHISIMTYFTMSKLLETYETIVQEKEANLLTETEFVAKKREFYSLIDTEASNNRELKEIFESTLNTMGVQKQTVAKLITA